jgi:hypothetical protein
VAEFSVKAEKFNKIFNMVMSCILSPYIAHQNPFDAKPVKANESNIYMHVLYCIKKASV